MDWIDALNRFAEPWSRYMGRSLIEVSLVLAVVLILWLGIRHKAPAQLGYGLFLLVLLKFVSPFQFTVPHEWVEWSMQSPIPAAIPWISPARAGNSPGVEGDPIRGQIPSVSNENQGSLFSSTTGISHSLTDKREAGDSSLTAASYWMVAWAGVVMAALVWFVVMQIKTRKVFQDSVELRPGTLPVDLKQLKQCLRMRKSVQLFMNPAVPMPVLWGLFRPRIILPCDITQTFSSAQIRWILLHELAHIRRNDLLVLGWQRFMQIVFFFHPAVWIANRFINLLREFACDDMALAAYNGSRKECGEGLLALIQRTNIQPAYALFPLRIAGDIIQIRRRMMRILDTQRNLQAGLSVGAMLFLLGAALLVLPTVRAGEKLDSPQTTETKVENKTNAFEIIQKESESVLTLRRLDFHEGDGWGTGIPSFDGQYYPYVGDTGDLFVRNARTGEMRQLTHKSTWEESGEFAMTPCISHDNKQIAYAWYIDERNVFELRIIDTDGSNLRILDGADLPKSPSRRSDGYQSLSEFSPDGTKIKAHYYTQNDGYQTVIVSVKDGTKLVLKTKGEVVRSAYSPDGIYIAYDFWQSSDASKRDISILDVAKNQEIPLIQHPANDQLLGWSPDGEWIFFISDRMNSQDAYVSRVKDGKAIGVPRMIKNQIGDIMPLGFTKDGSFYFANNRPLPNSAIFFGKMDWEKKNFIESAGLLGFTVIPKWSCTVWIPKGSSLCWIADSKIYIQNLGNGEKKEIPISLKRMYCLRCTQDEKTIFVSNYDENDDTHSVHQIDVNSGAASIFVHDANRYYMGNEISPDDKSIYTLCYDKTMKQKKFLQIDIESKQVKELYSNPLIYWESFALSPDGKQLVFSLIDRGSDTACVSIYEIDSGEYRELVKRLNSKPFRMVDWTPDGQSVYFLEEGKRKSTLWKVSARGGDSQKVWEPEMNISYLRLHPDGQQIGYEPAKSSNIGELWVMEIFLPKE
ncbi:MAG: M56 family metallopeptidase [bacterium]